MVWWDVDLHTKWIGYPVLLTKQRENKQKSFHPQTKWRRAISVTGRGFIYRSLPQHPPSHTRDITSRTASKTYNKVIDRRRPRPPLLFFLCVSPLLYKGDISEIEERESHLRVVALYDEAKSFTNLNTFNISSSGPSSDWGGCLNMKSISLLKAYQVI